MQTLPEVDVVLLSWNRAQMTIETLDSILSQEGVSLKIWVVDQGSRREELELLKAFSNGYQNIHVTELAENVGVPAGRNIGTRLGKAPYTVSIDNDAAFENKDSLKKVVTVLENEPEIGAISFRIKNYYTRKDDELSWVFPKALKNKRDERFTTTRFVGCGHAIRRQVFEQTGGYDDSLFFYWEETDLSIRIIDIGYQIVYLPEISVLHKVSPEVRVKWDNNRFYYLVRNALYIDYKYHKSILRIVFRALGYLLKGSYNGLIQQTIRGLFDSNRLIFRIKGNTTAASWKRIQQTTKDYVWQYETVHRGNLLQRIQNEILTALPGREES